MTDLRTAAQQALEALERLYNDTEIMVTQDQHRGMKGAITALRAALAEPVQEQDIEDAIEAAYWQFDCRKSGLNEWASAPQSERDAFKAEARKLVRGYFPTRQAQDTKREMLAVADAFIRGKRAALAEPIEPVAWMVYTEGGTSAYVTDNPNDLVGAYRALPLYTAPPQRKPLTEEEIDSIWDSEKAFADIYAIARAIERAHGIV